MRAAVLSGSMHSTVAILGALLLLVALVGIQQFATFTDGTIFASTLNNTLRNALHIPLFATLTLLLARIFGAPRWWVLLPGAFLLGIVTEVLQFLTNGTPSLGDLALDLIGIVPVVTGLEVTRRLRRRRAAPMRMLALWAALFVLLAVATAAAPAQVLLAYQQRDAAFPELLNPGAWRWSPLTASNSRVVAVVAPDAWTDRAGMVMLEVTLANANHPGIQLSEVVPDWSAFDALVVEAFLPEGPPIPLTAAVGYHGTEGISARVRQMLYPGAQRLRYPVSALLAAGEGAPPRISHLVLHTEPAFAGRSLLIGRVALEPPAKEPKP